VLKWVAQTITGVSSTNKLSGEAWYQKVKVWGQYSQQVARNTYQACRGIICWGDPGYNFRYTASGSASVAKTIPITGLQLPKELDPLSLTIEATLKVDNFEVFGLYVKKFGGIVKLGASGGGSVTLSAYIRGGVNAALLLQTGGQGTGSITLPFTVKSDNPNRSISIDFPQGVLTFDFKGQAQSAVLGWQSSVDKEIVVPLFKKEQQIPVNTSFFPN
jgi:hypothetical protein